MPVYNVESYLDECLESLVAQSHTRLEIIIVDDGATDASGRIARRWARRDRRIRVVRQDNAGLGAARNTGVERATGEYLAFLDSDDVVEEGAYADAVGTLARTGSDFAVLSYRRIGEFGVREPRPWIRRAHRSRRERSALVDVPGILVNVVAWTKVYRRAFWDSSGMRFPVDRLYEDQASSMRAYARARRFDVLDRSAVLWRVRDDKTSITQQFTAAENMRHRRLAAMESLDALRGQGQDWVVPVRAAQIMANDLTVLFAAVDRLDGGAWRELCEFVRSLLPHIVEERRWATIDARNKVMAHLCAAGLRDDAARFVADGGWSREGMTVRMDAGTPYADFPHGPRLAALVPRRALLVTNADTALTATLQAAHWRDGQLELAVRSRIRGVEPGAGDRVVVTVMHRGTAVAAASASTSDDTAVVGIPGWAFFGSGRFSLRVVRHGSGLRRSAELRCPVPPPWGDCVSDDGGRVLTGLPHRGGFGVAVSPNAVAAL